MGHWGSSCSFILHSFLDMSRVQWLMLLGTNKKNTYFVDKWGDERVTYSLLTSLCFFLERYPNSPRFAGSDMIFCQQNNAFYSTLFNGVSVGVFRAWCVHFFFEYSCSTNPKQWWICWLTNQMNHLSCETHHLWGASLRKRTPWMIILLKCIARSVGSFVTFQDWLGFGHNSTRQG